jgi:hypothetical protein
MAKKLTRMNAEDMRQEMSCAGSPDKIVTLMNDINSMIWHRVNNKNIAELINVEFALDRVKAEVKLTKRKLEKIHSAKIMEQINNQKNNHER